MNFDLLLEEACESLGAPAQVFYNFKELQASAIYKIHGTVKKGGGEPIIGIDESHIFKDRNEEAAVIDLLTQNHVVIIGYSGVDEKILHALRSVPDTDSEIPPETLTNLFVINLSGPGNRLPNIQQKRRSETLVLEGVDAGFENFMEGLEQALAHPEDVSVAFERPAAPSRILYSTQLEAVAANECRRLALNIRATINVAETGRISIIEHGEELFETCLELARSAGIALTSPEKYLILCAGYLHDLGYFLGYTTDRASENPGWQLLEKHGKFTAELLEKYIGEDWKRRITPAGYSDESRAVFVSSLIDLCRSHSLSVPLESPNSAPEAQQIEIQGIRVRFRPALISALFATAEELAEGHPFFPSPDPIELDPKGEWTMEDPVLDLYLRQKGRALRHEILPGRIVVEPETGVETLTASAAWLLTLAYHSVRWFDGVARQHGGRGVKFDGRFSDRLPLTEDNDTLIRNALKENLTRMLDLIPLDSVGETRAVVDLLALHTLALHTPDHPSEPRLDAKEAFAIRGTRRQAREPLLRDGGPWQNAFSLFFLQSDEGPASEMVRRFRKDLHEIIYPAWRFCARSLHTGVNAICLSRLVFDLGSTPFRAEFAFALRHLASEKVKWDEDKENAFGHDGCTLCTSRLLYIFSYARLVRRPGSPDSLPAGKRRGTDEIVRALLRTMLNKETPLNWWGISKTDRPGGGIHSADYAAWAVRSLAFCLAVDQEVRSKKESPLLSNRQEVIDLLAERLEDLCNSEYKAFIDNRSEEPHSYVIGDVAITLLETERLLRFCGDVSIDLRKHLRAAREALKTATTELDGRNLSLISKLYLWPAKVFLHEEAGPEQESIEAELFELHRSCTQSPIWIRDTEGSWGYNEENTQRLVSAMNAFWRYAFENRGRFEPLFANRA